MPPNVGSLRTLTLIPIINHPVRLDSVSILVYCTLATD